MRAGIVGQKRLVVSIGTRGAGARGRFQKAWRGPLGCRETGHEFGAQVGIVGAFAIEKRRELVRAEIHSGGKQRFQFIAAHLLHALRCFPVYLGG